MRGDGRLDLRLVARRTKAAEEFPTLGVLDRLAGVERDQGAEGLDLEHVFVGEGLEVDAVVGVDLPLAMLEPLDEKGAGVEIADASHLVRQSELGRSAIG